MNKVVYLRDVFYPSHEDWQRLGLLERTMKVIDIDVPDTILYDIKVDVKNKAGTTLAKLPVGMSKFSVSTIMINNSSILAPFKGDVLDIGLEDNSVKAVVEKNYPYIASKENRCYGNISLKTAFGEVILREVSMRYSDQVLATICLPFDLVSSLGHVNVSNVRY